MDANALTPRDLFEGKEHFEIPPFQRPYVWDREHQWEPLWKDIQQVAGSSLSAEASGPSRHFLGAIVYASRPTVAGEPTRHDVIDGQQRMTTVQIVLRAVSDVMHELGEEYEVLGEALDELTSNSSGRFRKRPVRFKLWPSTRDRDAFERIMDSSVRPRTVVRHRLDDAYEFFYAQAKAWISGEVDEESALGTMRERAEQLNETLQNRLMLVSINLSGDDDAQLIFETLNDRGTPLLKADLIKNWIFREGERLSADVDYWATQVWEEFDGDWWREEIKQGRLIRPRVDVFLQYWLTMTTAREVRSEEVFRAFSRCAQPFLESAEEATEFLHRLRNDADNFRSLSQLDPTTPEGRFHRIAITHLEQSFLTPVLLWFLSKKNETSEASRAEGLAAVESWAVRRMLMRVDSQGGNRFVVTLLRELASNDTQEAGAVLVRALSEQSARSSFWPSDEEMLADIPRARFYGQIRRDRLVMVLSEVERWMRSTSNRIEDVSIPENLQVEHVMPQTWQTYWDKGLSETEAAERRKLVNTLGNLTLVTGSLNGSLSNRPWTDDDAAGLTKGGQEGQGKRSLVNEYSVLVMNKRIVDEHPDEWTEQDILKRSEALVEVLCQVWGPPVSGVRKRETPKAPAMDENSWPSAWSRDDVALLAHSATGVSGDVLDVLSEISPQSWGSKEFREEKGMVYVYSALGGLANKITGLFPGRESPVIYEEGPDRWYWSVPEEFAILWKEERSRVHS